MSADIRSEMEHPLVTPELLAELETLINQGLEKLNRPLAHVDITLVDEAEIQRLNREYRKIDAVTDVLSFALEEGEEEPAYLRGKACRSCWGILSFACPGPRCKPRSMAMVSGGNWVTWPSMAYCTCWGMITITRKNKKKCGNRRRRCSARPGGGTDAQQESPGEF